MCEVIKYALYDRELLPMPYDEFGEFLRENYSPDSSPTSKARRPLTVGKQQKASSSFKALDHILTTISRMVGLNLLFEIRVLFGSTVVLPREQYLIRLPRCIVCNECANPKGLRQCMRDMLSTMVRSSVNDARLPSSAKMVIFLRMNPGDIHEDIMDIRPNFRVPQKGKVTEFKFEAENCQHFTGDESEKVSSQSAEGSVADEMSSPDLPGGSCVCSSEGSSSDDGLVWVQCRNAFSAIHAKTFRPTSQIMKLDWT